MTDATICAPILLVRSGGAAALPHWREAFREPLPGVEIRDWTDPSVDPARVCYVLVWEPEPGRLADFPNLQLIFSSAAGVDHIVRDPELPRHVPVVRMGADDMTQTVCEYICLGALMILRDLPRILASEREARWDRFELDRTAKTTRIGIMGMGRIGQRAAGMLAGIGFPVHGWARRPRAEGGLRCFAGMEELETFLGGTDILVAILPDTRETRGLMDATRLAMLPHGASLISAGRGTLIVMPDLLAALDSKHISLAVIDVFETEPLPPEDPAWRHDRIIVTPHLAGFASRQSRAISVAAGIAQHVAGEPLTNLYDPRQGY